MPVHVVADAPAKLISVRKMLEPDFPVTSELLGGTSAQRGKVRALVVRADLRMLENIHALRKIIRSLSMVRKRIFLVDTTAHLHISQAYALGATRILLGPLNQATLHAELYEPVAGTEATDNAQGSQIAAAVAEAALASMFSAVATGLPIDVHSARSAGSHVADSIAEHGLADWLTTVRRHHEGTYQHCLLVTGIAVDFGLSLGVAKADIERLYSAAMFHDVGKAKVPLEILDKPGKLDAAEWVAMKSHPVLGAEILSRMGALAGLAKIALEHHEKLDGTGYPYGRRGEELDLETRIVTAADIFDALTADRPYRKAMSTAAALGIMRAEAGIALDGSVVAALERSIARLERHAA